MVRRKSKLSRSLYRRRRTESSVERKLRLTKMKDAAKYRRHSEKVNARNAGLATLSEYSQNSSILIYIYIVYIYI